MTRPHPHDNIAAQAGVNEVIASGSFPVVGPQKPPLIGDDMERRMLRAMFACSPDAIIITDPQRRFVMLNPVAERMFGYSEAEVVGRGGELFHADSRRLHELDPRLPGSQARQHLAAPLMLRRKDGSTFVADATRHALNDADGSVTGYLTLVRDVTQQLRDEEERQQVAQALRRSEADLRRLAYHDPLTGLANRARLLERLREMMGRQTREPVAFAVLFIDFDRFKMINDTMGHEVGDQLLVSIADRLNGELGGQDRSGAADPASRGLAGRIGGDEFVMLLPDVADVLHIDRFVGHLQRELTQPHDLAGQAVVCTASIGIVMVRGGEYERPEQIMRDADIAMYEAKASGRSRSAWFDQHMRNRILERASLESDLRKALDERLFRLHFQPIFSLESGEATGFEAVIRWPDANRGMVPPHRFLPIAQEMG
ncbi:MAG: diguanylate cyclase, partial [Phycisphaeraceae bacterium]